VNVGGNMFQTFGVMMGYPRLHGQTTRADRGRYNVTGRYEDLHVFKVPGLRNVALTPPYFHDGSAHTLEQAVSVMAQYQLGHPLDALETRRIVRFLKSLTGEYKGVPL
jgi:cytochrome c peroxidase